MRFKLSFAFFFLSFILIYLWKEMRIICIMHIFQKLSIFTKILGFNIIEHLKSFVWNFKFTSTKNKFVITFQTSKLKTSK